MPIAEALRRCLEQNNIDYEILSHRPTASASQAGEASRVSGEKIAKGVLVKDNEGYTLAVLPASHHARLREIGQALESLVGLATEQEVGQIFTDCVLGAIPPIGAAYGLKTVVDEKLYELEDVYFEGGDHTSLVRVNMNAFSKLIARAQRAHFAKHD